LDIKNIDYVMQGIENIAREKNILVLCVSHDHDIIQKYRKNIIKISMTKSKSRYLVAQ